MELTASFISGRPKAIRADVGAGLTRMRVLPLRGRAWAPLSMKALLDRRGGLGISAE